MGNLRIWKDIPYKFRNLILLQFHRSIGISPLHYKFTDSILGSSGGKRIKLPCQLRQKRRVPSAIRPCGKHHQQAGWLLFGCLKPSSVMPCLTHPAGFAPQERVLSQALTEKSIDLVFSISATLLLIE